MALLLCGRWFADCPWARIVYNIFLCAKSILTPTWVKAEKNYQKEIDLFSQFMIMSANGVVCELRFAKFPNAMK
jgi:hypothetical protein